MDADFDSTASRAHVQRAMTLIAISLVIIACTAILYVHPLLPNLSATGASTATVPQSAYRVAAVDFVNPRVGWVVALLAAGDIALLHTTDGGGTWKRQLSVAGDVHPRYIKFFSTQLGVFALLGTRPVLYRTSDGGATWQMRPALEPGASVVSWSFVDPDRGWMLARDLGAASPAPVWLWRTEDGGLTWANLGPPVAPPAQAYQVHFSDLATGWLATSGPTPHAYRSDDLGMTWTRLSLPAPVGVWPSTGQFFVGVQPTFGVGVLASIVYFPPIKGRSGIGGTIRAYPPLTVRSFDGGRPYTYTYTTVLDRFVIGGRTGQQAPNETVLTTIDNGATWTPISPPSTTGAIGFFGPTDWLWVGAGVAKISADGGVTWTDPRSTGALEPLPGLLQVVDRDHAWFAAATGTHPVLQSTSDGGRHWRSVTLPPIVLSP